MKKPHQLVLMAAVVLVLAGCSAATDSAGPATPSAAKTQSPTPTPTPTQMPVEEAGTYYLSIVCPANAASQANANAYVAQDLASIQTTAGAARDAFQTQVKQFTDPMKIWPDTVAADIKTLVESDYQSISLFDQVARAQSLDAANAVVFPADNAGAAAQRIRVNLGLSADTSVGCS
ncbi:hypothetical protein [Leifsonia aquatica]|uniref:hypothetical protein n=1 Tax=Leifsonia aquatica TaxID=144185 RepID=UPI0037F40D83